ncbi:MAG: hypothetical protein BMS9Abin33_0672 [Gammaproteobacteria bacterium]|nr:MAG: hypothetical protein BMS9Abin33_0672 [Gammaproteobacteria bacterium]
MTENNRKQQIKSIFSEVASGYDNAAMRYFPFCADKLMSLLKPGAGQKLLDVATGTGAVAIAAAQLLVPEGRVTAIDFSETMLNQAEKNITKMGLSNVDLHVMDAESLEFRKDYFDYVVCSFGLFFLDDMAAGLNQWARVCRPGGKIAFTSFGSEAFKPMIEMFIEQAKQYGIESEKERKPLAIELLTDPEKCKACLENAGLGNCSVQTEQMGYHLGKADEWWDIVWNSGLRGTIMQLPQDKLGQFKHEHLAEVEKLRGKDGIFLNVQTHFSSALKPVVH